MINYFTKLTLLILFFFSVFESTGQTVAIYGSANYGRFYDFAKQDGYFDKNYKPEAGFKAGIEIKDIKIDSFFYLKFAIGFERYGGYFYTRDGGHGGSYSTEGEITKDVLTFQFYPFNFQIANHINLSAGLELNALLNYQLSGMKDSWTLSTSPPYNTEINTNLSDVSGFVKSFNKGLNFSLGYEFMVKNIVVEPFYNFYWGISKEFDRLEAEAKSFRHSAGFSIGLKI